MAATEAFTPTLPTVYTRDASILYSDRYRLRYWHFLSETRPIQIRYCVLGCAIWRFLILDDKIVSTIYFRRNIIVPCYSAHSVSCSSCTSISYWTTPHPFSVNSAVELLSRDTALIHNHKSTLFAYVLKSCRLSFSFCSDVHFFWARTPEARALKSLSNSAWLLN